jgi:hypothetical protein
MWCDSLDVLGSVRDTDGTFGASGLLLPGTQGKIQAGKI